MNSIKNCNLAVDYGGTKMLVGVVDNQGIILFRKRYTTGFRNQKQALQLILTALDNFFGNTRFENYRIRTIGIAIVGNVDPSSGFWFEMYGEDDKAIHLANIIRNKYGIPCFVDNDVKAATLAEMKYGAGQMANDFIYLNIGTGIAAGFVCNEKLVRGKNNDAGEIGHIFIEGHNTLKCWCGKFGCFEAISSGFGIERQYNSSKLLTPEENYSKTKSCDSTKAIFFKARNGNIFAKQLVTNAADGISKMIINLQRIFNPEVVVLNGGIVAPVWFMKMINKNVMKESKNQALDNVFLSKINPGSIGLIGASMLGFDDIKIIKENLK